MLSTLVLPCARKCCADMLSLLFVLRNPGTPNHDAWTPDAQVVHSRTKSTTPHHPTQLQLHTWHAQQRSPCLSTGICSSMFAQAGRFATAAAGRLATAAADRLATTAAVCRQHRPGCSCPRLPAPDARWPKFRPYQQLAHITQLQPGRQRSASKRSITRAMPHHEQQQIPAA